MNPKTHSSLFSKRRFMKLAATRDALMTPTRKAQPLIDALADAKTVVLEKSGHAMLVERPEQVLDQLISIV